MIRVSSTEFGKEVGRYQDLGAQPAGRRDPLNGRDRTVVISADEYQRLKRRDRLKIFAAGELPGDIVDAVGHAPRGWTRVIKHLDALLKDWTPCSLPKAGTRVGHSVFLSLAA